MFVSVAIMLVESAGSMACNAVANSSVSIKCRALPASFSSSPVGLFLHPPIASNCRITKLEKATVVNTDFIEFMVVARIEIKLFET